MNYDELDENFKKLLSSKKTPQNLLIINLLKRVDHLEKFNEYLLELIPMKYKKFSHSGNPFFSFDDIKATPEDYQKAKERMASLLEKNIMTPLPKSL